MNTTQKNWLIGFVVFLPAVALLDMWAFTTCQGFIREANDTSVVLGVIGQCVLVLANILYFKFILTKTKIMKKLFSILLLAAISYSCTRIDAGYEGILIKQYGADKGVQDVTLVTGRVTYNPWTEDVEQFPLFVQTVDYEPFKVNAKDGSEFSVDPTISLSVIKGFAPSIYIKYRKDIDEIIHTTLYNYVRDAFRIQFNKFTTDDITGRREEFESNVQKYLIDQLEKEGFHLEQLTSGLKYPDVIVNAINAKNQAVQEAMKIENQVKAAEANAKIMVAKAEGDAKALVIQARADAEANELRQRSLNSLLIQQQFIEKWDGTLPVYGAVPQLFKDISKN